MLNVQFQTQKRRAGNGKEENIREQLWSMILLKGMREVNNGLGWERENEISLYYFARGRTCSIWLVHWTPVLPIRCDTQSSWHMYVLKPGSMVLALTLKTDRQTRLHKHVESPKLIYGKNFKNLGPPSFQHVALKKYSNQTIFASRNFVLKLENGYICSECSLITLVC